MSLMFSTTTPHLVYRACGIRLAGISQYLRANQALIRTRNFDGRRRLSPRRIRRDSIELDDASAVSQSTTRHSQVWDAVVSSFSDGIVKSRSTEIEHGLLRPVTLHQAEDGMHWFCHEILPELNGLSPSKRLAICSDIQK